MSVILKANELHVLIYKYLQEADLTHTAFGLLHQSKLEPAIEQYKYSVKPGHLVGLLQKSLIYSQIQSHTSMSQYTECKQPFFLLKPHTCKITEKIKHERQETIEELTHKINDSVKRTNNIYNSHLVNEDYEDIVWDSKGSNYLQKFYKVRLPEEDKKEEKGTEDDEPSRFYIRGLGAYSALYDSSADAINLLHHSSLTSEVTLQRMYSCLSQGEPTRLLHFTITPKHLLLIFPQNNITVYNLQHPQLQPLEFTPLLNNQIIKACYNQNLLDLVCFSSATHYQIVCLEGMAVLAEGAGMFEWRMFDQCVVAFEGNVSLHKLGDFTTPLQSFVCDQFQPQQVTVSSNKHFLALSSNLTRKVQLHTFTQEEPLFSFNLQSPLKKTFFFKSNEIDFLCLLTTSQLKIFDISLGSYSKIIEISQFENSYITEISILKKEQSNEVYLLGLGDVNIMVFDVSNSKIERIEISQTKISDIRGEGEQGILRTTILGDRWLYFVEGGMIQPLFK